MNREIYVATALSRTTAKWRNKKTTWEALAHKCSETTRTHETLAEYKLMGKPEQSDLKDVGGFVGGYLNNGKRSKDCVKFRDVLCLDIDYGQPDTWDNYCNAIGYEAFCYSTHKYTSSVPRIRLVILLDRSVTSEEYEAVGRAVAAQVGIELFDDTTYEAERLMYWPSTSKDGEWFYRRHEGDALDVDGLLNSYYLDWQDVSEWPYSSRVSDKVRHDAAKQGDPTQKSGIVGAFCRTYDIYAAIEKFLPDVYTPTAIDNRFTFAAGTVAAGLVVYEGGKFAYSHNSTDPCSQHLVNAFDLVRLHKFGIKDEDADPDTAIQNMPSYKAMTELASTDPDTKKLLMSERTSTAVKDFASIGISEEEPSEQDDEDDSWMADVELNKNGSLKNTIANVCAVLENAPEFKGKLWFDEFSLMESYHGRLPWSKEVEKAWSNADSSCLREHLERKYGLTGKDRIEDALVTVCHRHPMHPIRKYLRSLTWDGVPRLDTLFVDFLGADDNELIRMQTRKQLTAAVARVMTPGCKFDNVTVLVGEEGIGKSTILAKLAGRWFNDSLVSIDGKEGMESLTRSWIIEIGELVGLKRSEVENAKSYITRTTDTYRPAYGRRKEDFPRQCVFFATTNEQNFLKGFYGNRRFWVIETNKQLPKMDLFKEFDKTYRDQVWAEAVMRYDNGEDLHLNRELEREAREVQKEFNELSADERVGMIERFLETLLPADWEERNQIRRAAFFRDADPVKADGVLPRNDISSIEVYCECFQQHVDEKTRFKTREIFALLSQVPGWKVGGRQRQGPYGQQRVFTRINPIKSPIIEKEEDL